MRTKTAMSLGLLGAAGLAASVHAQPTVVNLSGATLLENFLRQPAATNDYLDCDGDGIAGILSTGIDNLTPTTTSTAFGPNDLWVLTYRLAGSVAGYQELIDFGQVASGSCAVPTVWSGNFVTGNAVLVNPPNVVFGNTGAGPVQNSNASKQYYNGTLVYDTSVTPNVFGPLYTTSNVAGLPVGANLANLRAVTGAPAAGGYRVDAAPVDVPSTWAVRGSGSGSSAAPTRLPTQQGYGLNPRTSVNAQGTGGGFIYNLANLGVRNLDAGAPDCNTIFDSQLAFAPVAMLTNYGTGVQQLDQAEVNFFFATGRLLNGENLVAVTREIGSGTRNGFNNAAGLDPSWGVGDNVGGSAPQVGTTGNANILGDLFLPSNKIGSGDTETTVRNHRLAMGYSGAERFTTANANRYELVAIRCSLAGGTAYARPTLDNLLNNVPGANPSLYSIGGPAILATVGDPRHQAMVGGTPGNTNPRMANAQAAAFVNNMTRSIEAFVSVPGSPATQGMPGEFAATLLVLNPARQYRNDVNNPSLLVVNPGYNASLAAALPAFSVLDDPPVNAAFGSVTRNGQSPARRQGAGITYSDGVVNGANYINQGGASVTYNTALATRNRIAGDFNGDGLRNLSDATEMLRAYRQRNGGPVWNAPAYTGPNPGSGTAGTEAVIEILGDFNGDGNFDAKDVRYWADGLAIDPLTGNMDRKKGFKAIDDAWQALTGGNNFFGTTIAGGRPYSNGDSMADVAGAAGIARGWAPVGADGIISGQDAAYIQAQFTGNPFVTDGHAGWNNLSEAVGFDLSGDVTGDLIVDQLDLAAINTIIGACYADCDGNQALNVNDFICFQSIFAAASPQADCDQNSALNVNDFICFQSSFAAGCP